MTSNPLTAGNRRVTYLRISITDRCNLRCRYCMPEQGVSFVPHEEVLSYEELYRIVRVAAINGVRKVRITGGEPLVRKGLTAFLQKLSASNLLNEITLNGVLLEDLAGELKDAGLLRINVSLDSLRPERFRLITGKDYFFKVLAGIREAQKVGFRPIKINVVVMRGVNDDEILDFVSLARSGPLHVRFIEYMPIGRKNGWRPEQFVPIEEMKRTIEEAQELEPMEGSALDGPAARFRLKGSQGEIGFIGALSNHFCDRCNRLRLTAEGKLRSCLFSDREIDLKGPLRSGADDEFLLRLLHSAAEMKPENHFMLQRGPRKCARLMSSIGG